MFPDHPSTRLAGRHSGMPRRDYIFARQKELVLELVKPLPRERLLDIGCGAGHNLQIFNEKWCSLTGVDASRAKLEIARQRYGDHAEFVLAQSGDIPFSDNEFDIVTIINFLEVADNPRKVIEEAVRVCRGRIFIGFLNNYSFFGTRQGLKENFGFSLSRPMRFFSYPEIKSMVENIAGETMIKWGSVIYFPAIVYDFFEELEEVFPLRKNPFGAFVGMTFPVKYTIRTVQSPIVNTFQLNNGSRKPTPEVVRDMLKQVQQ
ncbi:MAG TPA: methyltransferase domain-containing protein [Smithella sp.]|nr:methyltransferase domain-containing protein [Smithella sp.]MDM7986308.1 methyltransferase domain-containing protein [Smithella sp.]HNY49551.1 methyltransferase domain-containing protein [Smithella sp.]HOG89324.1 methyltransferase domain-containing protein [Smithella sp.]HOU50142.1 methyltransferase domain-containing protein [Smithella sp.]